MRIPTLAGMATMAAAVIAMVASTLAHTPGSGQQGTPAGAQARQPVRTTMEELHAHGGVPPGWRFTIPSGDPKAGRELFAKLECNKCHVVEGDFPERPQEPGNVGPALTGMGGHHPPEYIAQSILDPNAVIVTGPGHTGADGLSIMPSFADSLTVPELLALVAYLASLTDGDEDHEHDGAPAQVVGDYRIRVAYHAHAGAGTSPQAHGAPRQGEPAKPGHGAQGQPGHGAKGHGQAATPHARDHLMVFVTDAKTGEPVPYLPVTVTIHAGKAPPRTVKLGPMIAGSGFHYGADVTLPAGTTKLTVSIGPTTMRVMPSAAGRFAGTARATFDWPQ